jgi:protein involved in polysaccharide export with SLBB domain
MDGAATQAGGAGADATTMPENAADDAATTTAPLTSNGGEVAPGRFEFNAPPDSSAQRVIRVPYEALNNGDLSKNIVVRPKDMIIVPTPTVGFYFVGGHVMRPGPYTLLATKMNLKQAIISAGMFDPLAIPSRVDLVRRVGPNQEVFVRVNMDAIFAGTQPDIFLRPYDTINVGTNALAPFLASLRNAFRATYGFGFLYDRNFAYNQRVIGP